MLEQELNTEPKPRRSLRETERKRVLRNRLLGVGVILTLAGTGIAALRRVLPAWREVFDGVETARPATNDTSTRSAFVGGTAEIQPVATRSPRAGALPSALPRRAVPSLVRPPNSTAALTTKQTMGARRSPLFDTTLGPELLPVDNSATPRRRRRHRHATKEKPATAQTNTVGEKQKPAHANTPAAKPAELPRPPLDSRPPDDVPENP